GNETDLPSGTYIIMIEEIPLVSGTVYLDKGLTLASEAELARMEIPHEDAKSPVDGRDAFWIPLEHADRLAGRVWDAAEHMLRNLESGVPNNLALLFGPQEIVYRLEELWTPVAKTIAADSLMLARFARMAAALLEEHVPLTKMEKICQVFVDHVDAGMDDLLA